MLSVAVRLIYALDAHVVPMDATLDLPPIIYDKCDTRCHLRDLFWLCYSFDKDICLRTGQPPCIDDAHCELTLPSGYVHSHDATLMLGLPHVDKEVAPLFPWDLRLSILKSRIYQDLYTAHALRQSVPEQLTRIRNLDEVLETWRLSLPADFRPTLYFSQGTPVDPRLNTMAVILRLSYYYCVTMIHQASSRCEIMGVTPKGSGLQGITSSGKLSITASRSTISYLRTVSLVVNPECFWYEPWSLHSR